MADEEKRKVVVRCTLCGGFVARIEPPAASVEAVCTNHRCGATMMMAVNAGGAMTISEVVREKRAKPV